MNHNAIPEHVLSQVTNRAYFICLSYYLLTNFLARAELIDIDFCTKIMQLHRDSDRFQAFMRGLSQDDETEGFDQFLSLVTI